MNKVTRLGTAIGSVAVLGLATACASDKAHRVESGGTQSVVSLNKIDTQNWMEAADKMIASLVESGTLDRAAGQPRAVIGISRIVNKTTQNIDVDLLTKKIRVALNKSGKAVTTTTVGLGGKSEDPLAKGELERNEFYNEGENPNIKQARPNFTLSGKIIEDRARAGDTREVTYTFQLSLTDVRNGTAAWEDEVSISKQGKHNAVGW